MDCMFPRIVNYAKHRLNINQFFNCKNCHRFFPWVILLKMQPGKCQGGRIALTKGAACNIGTVILLHNLTSKVPNGQSQYFDEPIQSPSNPQNSNMMEIKRKKDLWEIYIVVFFTVSLAV